MRFTSTDPSGSPADRPFEQLPDDKLPGLVFAHDGASHDVRERRVSVLGVLKWLHLPIAVTLICCLRRLWLVVLGISIAAAWFSFGASAMSYLSVTNVWL
jgi:hypothetical protein